MIYFTVKSNIIYMESLLTRFETICDIETTIRKELRDEETKYLGPYDMFKHIREEALKRNNDYGDLRQEFARMIPKANDLCKDQSILWHREGRAAPLEGSMPFQGSIFDLVLDRPSDIMDIDNDVRATINKCIGSLEVHASKELRQFVNPFYWIRKLLIFIVRLPFTLIEISGFDVEKTQDHFLGKIAQFIYVILIILLLIWLGVESVQDLFTLIGPILGP